MPNIGVRAKEAKKLSRKNSAADCKNQKIIKIHGLPMQILNYSKIVKPKPDSL